ncbi:unnamed protein product, partial [Coregonus sp. 'balchen']
DITQKGYEKKRTKLLAPFLPQITIYRRSLFIGWFFSPAFLRSLFIGWFFSPGCLSYVTLWCDVQQQSSSGPTSGEPSPASPDRSPASPEAPGPSSSSGGRRNRSGGARDDRYRSDIHTEAVQAALAKHKEEKMALPMPTKRRSAFVQSPNSIPPDVTSYTPERGSRVDSRVDLPPNAMPRVMPRGQSRTSMLDTTADVPQPDPNTPRPEGRQIIPVKGEPLGVVSGPGTLGGHTGQEPRSHRPGRKLWSRSLKLAYTLLNKLGTKNEPVLRPGDRVALVYPNSDPAMFWVAFYGCLLAEVIPVAIEVPLSRQDAGSLQIGFLLGSFVKLTSSWPRMKWVVTDTKYLTKPSKDWQPHIPTANTDTAYIEYKASKEGTVMGVAVSKIALLTHCQALTQACNYCEGSVSSCDAFLNVFQSHGLKPEVICPCASSPEALTVAIRRPGARGAALPARAILSMGGLSHGVIRVNTEDKNSALTVQDVGHVMPGALMCIVKPDGPPQLCKTDEIGEIVLNSRAGGTMYYGLPGVTKNTFEVIPVNQAGAPIGEILFTRTGLLGFVGPGSLVFVVGKNEGLLTVSGRRHNADDLVATALAVEPVKTVYRGRIAVFSVTVFYDERIVIVAEQRPDASEEDSFQWMSRVLQAIDSIHQVGLYCLALVPANTLPKTPLGGIHISETKQNFLEGNLHPCNILLCPHTCVTNLPKPRQKQPVGVGPASIMVGNLVAGKRMAQAAGRELGVVEEEGLVRKHQFLSEALQWRAQTDPDHVLYVLLNAKGVAVCTATCSQLHKRAEKITSALMERGGLNTGDNVVLLYPPGIDLIAAFYGCLYAGVIPVTVRPPHPQNLAATLPTVRMIIDVSKAACILTTQLLMRILRSKEAAASVNVKTWPTIIDTDDLPRRRPPQLYKPPTAEMLAYLDFSVSTTGMLTGVKMSHAAVSTLCRSIKLQCELYSSRQIAICLDPYCGLGFSILIPPMELEMSLPLWLSTLSQYKIRDTFCSYSARGVNLSCVRSCVVIAEERPRLALTQSFSKLFKDLGLSPRAVSTAFGSRVNLAICLQGTAGPDPSTVYVDMKSLRHDRVRLVERGAPQSLSLMESGTILPGVRVIIVNPETRGPLGDSHLGEIWIQSPHSSSGYYTIYGEESLQADHFNTRLSFGEPHTLWARTGYLGFVKRTELLGSTGDRHDALFVVGQLDETLELRGLRYHPIDIETAVFTWTNLLVVVAELAGSEQEALDLVPLVTNVVLEEHHLIVGVVVIVDPGVIPINSRGEKQRMHLRDSFLADQLDPIYVAYNM